MLKLIVTTLLEWSTLIIVSHWCFRVQRRFIILIKLHQHRFEQKGSDLFFLINHSLLFCICIC